MLDVKAPSWGELTLAGTVVVAFAIVLLNVIKVYASKANSIPPEVIQVIKENSEVNAKLVTSVEVLIRAVQVVQEGQNGLLLAITKLVARIEERGE